MHASIMDFYTEMCACVNRWYSCVCMPVFTVDYGFGAQASPQIPGIAIKSRFTRTTLCLNILVLHLHRNTGG